MMEVERTNFGKSERSEPRTSNCDKEREKNGCGSEGTSAKQSKGRKSEADPLPG